jgi:hypothetical protein
MTQGDAMPPTMEVDGASKSKFNGERAYKEDIDALGEMECRAKRLMALNNCYIITKTEEKPLIFMGKLSLFDTSKLKGSTRGGGEGDT